MQSEPLALLTIGYNGEKKHTSLINPSPSSHPETVYNKGNCHPPPSSSSPLVLGSLTRVLLVNERPSFLDVDRFGAGDSGTLEGALLFGIGHLAADVGDML